MAVQQVLLAHGSAGGGGGGSDPFFANVVALLKLDTSLVDVTGKTWTPTGTATITTAQSQFGGASLELTSSGDNRIDCASTDFNFGTDPYTIEGWFRPDQFSNRAFFSFGPRLVYTASGLWAYFNGSTNAITGGSVNTSIFNHVVLQRRAGGSTELIVNGVLIGSPFSENIAINPGTMRLGFYNSGNPAGIFYDEFRVTRGVARYTAPFAPPTAPFPTS